MSKQIARRYEKKEFEGLGLFLKANEPEWVMWRLPKKMTRVDRVEARHCVHQTAHGQ